MKIHTNPTSPLVSEASHGVYCTNFGAASLASGVWRIRKATGKQRGHFFWPGHILFFGLNMKQISPAGHIPNSHFNLFIWGKNYGNRHPKKKFYQGMNQTYHSLTQMLFWLIFPLPWYLARLGDAVPWEFDPISKLPSATIRNEGFIKDFLLYYTPED